MTRSGGTYAVVSADDRTLYSVNRDSFVNRDVVSTRRVPVEGGTETDVVSARSRAFADWALAAGGLYYAEVEPRPDAEEETYVAGTAELLLMENFR